MSDYPNLGYKYGADSEYQNFIVSEPNPTQSSSEPILQTQLSEEPIQDLVDKADAKLVKLQGRLKKCSVCIGIVSILSMLSASVMILIGFPVEEMLMPHGLPVDSDFNQVGDQKWQEDWENRWEHNQPQEESWEWEPEQNNWKKVQDSDWSESGRHLSRKQGKHHKKSDYEDRWTTGQDDLNEGEKLESPLKQHKGRFNRIFQRSLFLSLLLWTCLLSVAILGYKGSKSQLSVDSKSLFKKAAGFVILSGFVGLFKMHNDFKMSDIIFGMIAKLDIKPDQQSETHPRNLQIYEVQTDRQEFNPAEAIKKVNSLTPDEVRAFFERKSSKEVYHFLSKFKSANAIEVFFGEMDPQYFTIFTTEFADKFDKAVLDAIIEGSILDEVLKSEDGSFFTAFNSINGMCKDCFRQQMETLKKDDFEAFAFKNFQNSDDLWWFLDKLDFEEFEIILDIFGRKFIKKLAKKLDRHADWSQEDDNPRQHRKLLFAEQEITPDIVIPSGPIAIGNRNLRSNTARANVIAQMEDLTNGIYMTGKKGGRQLHGRQNSDALKDEMKRWRRGNCNPMKKGIIVGALVWLLVMGGFLKLFKNTVKVMGKKEKLAQLKPIQTFQQEPQPIRNAISRSQLIIPNNYITSAMPYIQTKQVSIGQPTPAEVPQQTYTLAQVQALLEIERSRIARL